MLQHLLHHIDSTAKFGFEESIQRDQVWQSQFETKASVFEDFFDLSPSASFNLHPVETSILSEFPKWSQRLLSEETGKNVTIGHLCQRDHVFSILTESQSLDRFDEDIMQAFDFIRAGSSHFLDLQHLTQVLGEQDTALKLRCMLCTPDIVRHDAHSVTRSWFMYSYFSPIMERELQTKIKTILHTSRTAVMFARPKRVTDDETPSKFLKLLSTLHNKRNLIAEKCLWSTGSLEVMRKCRVQDTRRSNISNQRSYILREAKHRELFPSLENSYTGGGATMLGLDRHADELLRSYSSKTEAFLPLKVNVCEISRKDMRREIGMQAKPLLSHEKEIIEKLNTFDIIKRNPCVWLSAKILKIGAKPADAVSAQDCDTNGRSRAEHQTDSESTSQESLLDNILPSEGEDAVEDLIVPDLCGKPESCTGTRKVNIPQESIAKKLPLISRKNSKSQKDNLRLRVPESFVCSMWSVRAAEYCVVQMPRGTILLPPCLSALPTLCIVIYSHLANQLQDQRIAIICDAEADVSRGLHAYLENSFGRKVSIEIISRGSFSKEPRFASVNEYTAQVFILDSFDFSLPSRVSLLLILICQPHLFDSQTSFKSPYGQHLINPDWRHLSSILIAPLDSWVLFSEYVKRAEQISLELDMSAVLFIPEYDLVHHSVLLAKPRTLFLVPLSDASELVSVIDTHSSPILTRLRNFLNNAQIACCSLSNNSMFVPQLRDISVFLLRHCLEDQNRNIEAKTRADLETAYFLRQARSYALYDGFDVASAFLAHCVSEMSSKKTATLREVMKKVEYITAERTTAERDHPIIRPVMDHIRKARIAFRTEAPSLFSLHRRHAFRPLIIANSTETVDGFRRGTMKAKLILEAGERDLAVCWVNDLASLREKQGVNGYGKKVLERMELFSHIYHIIGDRDTSHPDIQLPAQILQLVHAGRTRLITVAVDERRKMEPTWTANEGSYSVMKKYLGDQRILAGMGTGNALCGLKWDTVQYMMSSLW